MDLKKYLNERKKLVDKALPRYLPKPGEYPTHIHQAMHYSVFAGGKRIRPVLVMAAAEAAGKNALQVLPLACAFELIHTYSLIHDDLPCMDDDDFRRGKPTCHKKFGEAIALLAGDALLTQAFYVMADSARTLPAARQKGAMKAIAEVAFAAGTKGMVGGQVADIESEGKPLSLPVLQYIHTHKTGALIRAALESGAMWSGATARQTRALAEYGEKTGLAFQVADDILNVVGNSKLLGKKSGTDAVLKKMTYPAYFGVHESKSLAERLVLQAKKSLSVFPVKKTGPLGAIADFIVQRQY